MPGRVQGSGGWCPGTGWVPGTGVGVLVPVPGTVLLATVLLAPVPLALVLVPVPLALVLVPGPCIPWPGPCIPWPWSLYLLGLDPCTPLALVPAAIVACTLWRLPQPRE